MTLVPIDEAELVPLKARRRALPSSSCLHFRLEPDATVAGVRVSMIVLVVQYLQGDTVREGTAPEAVGAVLEPPFEPFAFNTQRRFVQAHFLEYPLGSCFRDYSTHESSVRAPADIFRTHYQCCKRLG